MKSRSLLAHVQYQASKPNGRILVFTGARQTGKTTLSRQAFPEYTYLSIEDPVTRADYRRLTSAQWRTLYPRAVLDEVQKEPLLIESIKAVWDQWQDPRYVLLGSSQLLLLDKVRESLAGRCQIVEMFPLTLPELRTSSWSDDVEPSFFQRVLAGQTPDLLPSVSLDPRGPSKLAAWAHYSKVGGYPALTNPELTEDDQHLWLAGYVQTYLERDVRDLASFRDLEPFVRLQQWTALRTATVLNASAAAVEVGVSTKTVQKYLQYLELSYQALLVPAWHRNLTKRLTRAAKVHWLDHGVLQAVLRKRGGLSGPEFESLVVSELFKQTRNLGIRAPFFHLRTQDGLEVDLLIELPSGYLAFEMKSGVRVDAGDARHLRRLGEFLDKPVLGAWVVSQDPVTRDLGGGVSGVHVAALLG